ncbi:MAG: cytochrome c3 family protein [Candidatus Aminicenantia bacterium]
MKKLLTLLAITVLGVCVTVVLATVVGTDHDMSVGGGSYADTTATWVCVFCHTPHQASAASGQDPLWNHTLSSTANYGTYDSDTIDATDITDIGGAAAGSANVSNLCMSCHDGTIAVGSLWNPPNVNPPADTTTKVTGGANLGTDLSDDHPINFTYDSTLATNDGELNTPVSTSWVDAGQTVPLFSSKVQCASCHDPHDDTNQPFLVKGNTDSALCTTCHIK